MTFLFVLSKSKNELSLALSKVNYLLFRSMHVQQLVRFSFQFVYKRQVFVSVLTD